MKPAALSGMLLLFMAATAQAQLSLLPQVGIDRTKNTVSINDLSSFAPSGVNGNFKASLRLDYRFRGGHGPYVAVGTAPALVEISFANPSNAVNDFVATAGATQLKLEGGYQYSFKPLKLGKSGTTVAKERSTHCSSYFACGSRAKPANTPLNMRIQPSLGLAYNPFADKTISTEDGQYQYKAGNWQTALVPAMNFEFGQGRKRLFVLGVSYTKGLGNLDTRAITTIENTKPVTTSFKSVSNSWGLTLGVPIGLSKSAGQHTKSAKAKSSNRTNCESKSRCEGRSRCGVRI